LLVVRRHIVPALFAAVSGAAPIVLFGMYFHHRSGFFLPYSVMVKATGAQLDFKMLLLSLAGLSFWTAMLLPLLLLLIWVRATNVRGWDRSLSLGTLSALVASAHLLTAKVGWLMRYEAYLIAVLLTAVGTLTWVLYGELSAGLLRLPRWLPQRTAVAVVIAMLLLSSVIMVRRFLVGQKKIVESAVDRYDEHIQMARFVSSFYDSDTIVLDDIGAVAYYSNARILDMVGLGSAEPLRVRRKGHTFDGQDLDAWAKREHATIAILQPTPPAIRQLIPSRWLLLQSWKQPQNVVFAGDFTTSLYAVDPEQAPRLCSSLSSFKLVAEDVITYNACTAEAPASAVSH
jgi:hypothetical protein